MRTNNSECSKCGAKHYRRPSQLKFRAICVGCRKKEFDETWTEQTCPSCNKVFRYKISENHGKKRVCCSRKCSNNNRAGIKYGKSGIKSYQHRRLLELKQKYNVSSCMVEGCDYNKTYDIHRLIPGKIGGKYEYGNMFAICPNHHAEYHRKICILEKIDDCHLRAIYGKSYGIGEPTNLEN